MAAEAAPREDTAPRERTASSTTRDRLLRGAREAFARLGYAATRVDDIVERAGTSHGTFYTYFRDKREALAELTRAVANRIYGAALAPPIGIGPATRPIDIVRARMAAFLEAYANDWDVAQTWRSAEGVDLDVQKVRLRVRHSIVAGFTELLARDAERGLLVPGVRPELAATALVAMAEGFANEWLTLGRTFTDEDVRDLSDLWVRAVYRADV